MPDFLEKFYGLELNKALELVSSSGLEVKLTETKPPDKNTGQGLRRVILPRLTRAGDLEIIWSYEQYQ
jgi:hypothetical protein